MNSSTSPTIEHAPVALDPGFVVTLPNFEGPLDLLLHLIRKHELDVLDLPIAFITDKYVEYIGLMENLNLDVASEYLVMAATLAHIKSKMLLPRPPEDQDDDGTEGLDPRAELIARLLEYQKYKRVADELGGRGLRGRDVFTRGAARPKIEGERDLAPTNVFRLLDAFQKVAERNNVDLSLQVDAERISIQARINQIIDVLTEARQCEFDDLFVDAKTTYDLVVTLLALLEMAKSRILSLYQPTPDDPIYLRYTLLDDGGQPLTPSAEFDLWSEPDTPPRESMVVPAGNHLQDPNDETTDDD